MMKKEKKMNASKSIKKYYLFQFLSGFHMFSAVLIPFYTNWGGVSITIAQSLQSFFTFSVFMLEVPTGVIADMIGRKKSVALGCLITVVAVLVYGSYPSILLFVLGEFLFAAAVAFISGADKALIYDTLLTSGRERESVNVFGRSHSIHLTGIAAAALLGSFAAKYWGLNAPMLLTAIPSFFAALVIFTIPEPPVSGKNQEQRNFLEVLKKGLEPIRKNRSLRRWVVNSTIIAVVGYFVIWLYQPMMGKLGIGIEYFGLAHAGMVMAEVLVASNFQRLIKLFGSTAKYLNFTAYVSGASFILLAVWPNLLTLCVFLAVAAGFGLTRYELMSAQMNKAINSESRATAGSSMSMLQRIAQSATNPFVGLLTDRSISLSLFVVGLLPILTIFAPIKEKDLD